MRPAPLLWAGLGVAALAVLTFVAWSALHEPAVARSAPASAPDWAGTMQSLDSLGVYDTDLDGLSDSMENAVFGTDPLHWDSSGSGIPDGWLAAHGIDPLEPSVGDRPAATPPPTALPAAYGGAWPARFVPSLHDVYAAGRPADWNESAQGLFDSGLDPRRWDSRGDGIPDGWLLHHGLDPLDPDVGGLRPGPDGSLPVREAFEHNTDPRRADSDGDGLSDREEVEGPAGPGGVRTAATDPSRWDTAGGGVCDGYLVARGVDPHDLPAVLGDPDRDGATTRQEFEWSLERLGQEACRGGGLDPLSASSGGAPLPDGWLVRYGLDPLEASVADHVTQSSATDPQPDAAHFPPGQEDLEHVELTVLDEYGMNRPTDWDESVAGPWWGGTDPSSADTDGDGLGDAWEVRGFLLAVTTQLGEEEVRTYWTSSDPAGADTDRDGLRDGQEADPALRDDDAGGLTDPRRWDTDFDGIDDNREVSLGLGLDPSRADSAGDFLRDGQRLRMLETRSRDYQEDLAYSYAGPPGAVRSVADWIDDLPGAATLPRPLSNQAIAGLAGPGGDLDGDGTPNLLDDDMDGDALLNGWEADPRTYLSSIHGAGVFPGGRPATDPLNPDTDGDLLGDGWEVRYGVPDHAAGRHNLDPSRWDSDDDGTGDAQEDPDADGTTWHSYLDGEPTANEYPFTNLLEQQYGTDPNGFSSDGDGLGDGWKVFWAFVYPSQESVPADAERPVVGQDQSDVVVVSAGYSRLVLDPEGLLEWEHVAGQHGRVFDVRGGTRTVYRVAGQMEFGFLDVQAAGTNPYRPDTDGDGQPDWWEVLHATAPPGVSGDGGAGCVAVAGPSAILPDGGQDPDGDDLDNLAEFQRGTLPLCVDSDLGGIRDGAEQQFGLDPALPTDDEKLLREGTDSDGDGLLDFEELTGVRSVDYGYLGPGPVRTDHGSPDMDGDGLLDGATRPDPAQTPGGWSGDDARAQRFLDLGIAYYRGRDGGYFFLGERDRSTDPRDGDDAGIGVPAGWLAAHNLPLTGPDPALGDAYGLAMPPWWDQAVHGPWWGGAAPDDDLGALRRDPDLDRDGLLDRDGADGYEDPMPAANHHNALRPVDFEAHGLSVPDGAGPEDPDLPAEARRMLGQAFLSPRVLGDTYARDRGLQDTTPRTTPCLDVDPESMVLTKGRAGVVTGRVLASCPDGAPLAGVTVEARLGASVFGVGFSAQDGRFAVPVTIQGQHEVDLPARAAVFRGATQGTVAWGADPSLPVGEHTMALRSYATPTGPAYEDRVAPLRAAVAPVPVTVLAGSVLELLLPPAGTTGSSIPLGIHLMDSGGAPIEGTVAVHWDGATRSARTGPDGTTVLDLPAPHGLAGPRRVEASYQPAGSVAAYTTGTETDATIHLRQPADLELAGPASADAGSTVEFHGRLKVPSGAPGASTVYLNVSVAGRAVAGIVETTSTDGSFRAGVDLPADAVRGEYLVSATSLAGTTAESSRQSVTMQVRSHPRLVDVDGSNLTAGRPANVSARLVEPDGSPIPDAGVRIDLAGWEATARTDADGRIHVEVNRSLSARPVQQRITFDGDSGHAPAEHRLTRFVLSGTRVEVPDGRVGRGLEATVPVLLVDAQGTPVPGAPLSVRWGDDAPRLLLTNETGVATLVRPGSPSDALGPVVVEASFAGSRDASLGPSGDRGAWTVQTATGIDLPGGLFEAGQRVPPGVLRDLGDGSPMPDRTVLVRVDGSATREQVTDADGGFPVLPPTDARDLARRVEVSVAFPGDEVYAPVEATTVLDFRARSNVTVQAPEAVVAGRSALVLATVRDARGDAVPSGEVEALLDGGVQGRWPVTNGTARINLTLPADHAVGPVTLQVGFLGTSLHAPSSAETTLRVLAPVELHLEAQRVAPGEVTTVRVRALSGDVPVPFATVHLAVGGLETGLTGRTDRDGVAVFEIEQDVTAVAVAARYAGDGERGPALAALVVEPDRGALGSGGQLGLWVAIAVTVALVGLSGAARHLRRQPLEKAFRRAQSLLEARGGNEQQVLLAYRALEDAAIGHGILFAPATTAGVLEEALQGRLPRAAHPSLSLLIRLFDAARYGSGSISDRQRSAAHGALQRILDSMGTRAPRGGVGA